MALNLSSALIWMATFGCASAMRVTTHVTKLASEERPALCDSAIVKKTCRSIDIDNSASDTTVSIAEISHAMWATRASTVAFLKAIGIDAGSAPSGYHMASGGEDVSCAELCEKTVKSIPDDRLPPSSDVGCHSASSGVAPVCDIDLSPASLRAVKFNAMHADFHANHPVHSNKSAKLSDRRQHTPSDGLSITGHAVKFEDRASVPMKDAQTKVANLFRIYPVVDVRVHYDEDEDETDDILEDDTDIHETSEEEDPETSDAAEESSLISVHARLLPEGTKRPPLIVSGACQSSLNGKWEHKANAYDGSPIYYRQARQQYIYFDSACKPGQKPRWIISSPGEKFKPSEFAVSNLDGDGKCIYEASLATYDHTDPPLGGNTWRMKCLGPWKSVEVTIQEKKPKPKPTPKPKPRPRPPWVKEVEKVSIKAQAYVASAIKEGPEDSTVLKRWMGRDTDAVRGEVTRVLNSLSHMLSHVVYSKGPSCDKNTYAYVFPYGPRSKEGEDFVFYLCNMYFVSDEGEKIETLTHEGSHHATAYTDDVCAGPEEDGECPAGTAYGRRTCKLVAKHYPDKALKNADNYCYYINDINAER